MCNNPCFIAAGPESFSAPLQESGLKEIEEIRYRDRNVLEAFPGRNRFLLGVRELEFYISL